MNVVLIGSETFPVVKTGIAIARFIEEFPAGTVIYSRGSKGFDQFAAECARIMGYETQILPGRGGGFNFERDQALAEKGDELVAFFDPDRIGQGGTQHVIEKFLDANKPIRSFTANGSNLILVGSHDGDAE